MIVPSDLSISLNLLRFALAIGLYIVGAGSVDAQFVDGPVISDPEVTNRELVAFDVPYGICDALTSADLQVIVEGNNIQATVEGIRFTGIFCNVPPTTAPFEIGPFAPGDYTLDLYFEYVLVATGETQTEMVGSGFFSVVPIPAIPALSLVGMALLLILMLATVAAKRKVAPWLIRSG